jgi:beta-hydroxylase
MWNYIIFITAIKIVIILRYWHINHILLYLNYISSIFNINYYSNNKKVFYETNFNWCKELRDSHKEITEEFLKYQNNKYIPTLGTVVEHVKPISDNQKQKWRAVFLNIYKRETDICKNFPITCSILKKIPRCHISMFSILEPHKKIPIHSAHNHLVLRYQLGLIIPKDKENCKLTINNIERHWEEGHDMLFDDTFKHFVENNTNEQRVVLFLDVQKDMNNIFLNAILDSLFYLYSYNVYIFDTCNKVNKYND